MTETIDAKAPEVEEPKVFSVEEKLEILAQHLTLLIQAMEIMHSRVSEIEEFLDQASEPEEEPPAHGGH